MNYCKNTYSLITLLLASIIVMGSCRTLKLETSNLEDRFIFNNIPNSEIEAFQPLDYDSIRELEVSSITDNGGNIYTVSANPQKGYKYGYIFYIPRNVKKDNATILIAPIATGLVDVPEDEITKLMLGKIRAKYWARSIADSIGAPLLVPIYETLSSMSVSIMTSKLMYSKDEKYSRIDLQVLAMFENLRRILYLNYGIKTDEKAYMTGFSAGGEFTKLFVALRPRKIKAAAFGGISAVPFLPFSYDSLYKSNLTYPIGSADFYNMTGFEFDREEYIRIPQLIYEGTEDEEDLTIRHEHIYPLAQKQWIYKVMGEGKIERWNNYKSILKIACPNVQMRLLEKTGHLANPALVIEFIVKSEEAK